MGTLNSNGAGNDKPPRIGQRGGGSKSTVSLLALKGLFLAFLVLLLTQSFAINGLGVAKWNQWATWEIGSSAMVLKKIESDLGSGEKSPFGLGSWSLQGDGVFDRLPQLERRDDEPPTTNSFQPYISEIGGNGHFLSAVWRQTPCSSQSCLHGVTSFLFSITIVTLFVLLGRIASPGFVWAWLIGVGLSPWITMMGRNLFWSPWWWLLPVIAAALLSLSRSRSTRVLALLALWTTFFLRYYMTGYHEFLLVIVLAVSMCVLPALFPKDHPRQWRRSLRDAGHVLLAGLVTPIPVVMLHASILSTSMPEGLRRLWEHLVVRRSWGDAGDDINPIGVLWQYLWSDGSVNFLAFAIDRQGSLLTFALGPQSFVAATSVALIILIYRGIRREQALRRDLVLFSLGFASAGIWLIAARNYAYYHTAILSFVWYFLLVPSLLFIIGDFAWQLRIHLSRLAIQVSSNVRNLLWETDEEINATQHLVSSSDSIHYATISTQTFRRGTRDT